MKKLLFALVVCATTILNSCKEEKKEVVYLHQNTIDFFEYKDGSTWNYMVETAPGEEVEYTSSNYQRGIATPGISQLEFLQYELNPTKGHKITIRAEAGAQDPIDQIVFINYNDTAAVYDPIIWSDGVNFSAGKNSTLKILDTLTVNNILYKDVMYIKASEKEMHSKYYIAKGIGVIKRVLNINQTYSLKNHKVIR